MPDFMNMLSPFTGAAGISNFSGPGGLMDELFGGGAQAAAQAQQGQLRQGMGAIQQGTQQGENILAPFQGAGQQSIGQLMGLLGQDPMQNIQNIQGQFQQSPSQVAQQQSSVDATNNALQAQGMAGSGAVAPALASTIGNVLGGQQNQFLQNVLGQQAQQQQGLFGVGGLGASAAGQGAQMFGQQGQSLADMFKAMGQSQAAGAQGRSAGIGGALNAVTSFL